MLSTVKLLEIRLLEQVPLINAYPEKQEVHLLSAVTDLHNGLVTKHLF